MGPKPPNPETGYRPEMITVAGVERGRYFLVVEHHSQKRINISISTNQDYYICRSYQ